MVIARSIVTNVAFGFFFGLGFGVMQWLLSKCLK